jgi:hypothetical protein
MSDNTNASKNVRDDEIDLLDLFKRIGRTIGKWTNALLKGFLISLVFMLRHWLPLLISIIAGVTISYVLKSNSSSFYTSDLVLRNNMVKIDKKTKRDNSGTTAEILSKINKLHLFCQEINSGSLAKALSLKEDYVKGISDISAFWIIDLNKDGIPDNVDYKGNHDVYDTINIRMLNILDVRVKFTSGLDLNKVRDGIIKFIEDDSLFQQRNRLRLKQNHELLSRLNYDIKQLDSLQKVKYFEETRNMKPGNGGQIIFMQEQNTQLVYNDIYYLYDKKRDLEAENDLYENIVTVIDDFSMPTIRENDLMFYGRKIIPRFFIITLIILILYANRKRLIEIYKKY